MTPQHRAPDDHDEPALLRDQFRQLLRYRSLLAVGVVMTFVTTRTRFVRYVFAIGGNP